MAQIASSSLIVLLNQGFPARFLAATVGEDSVALTWQALDDNTANGYLVFRRVRDADPPVEFGIVGQVRDARFTDVDVESSAACQCQVRALNIAAMSEPSNTVDVDIPQPLRQTRNWPVPPTSARRT